MEPTTISVQKQPNLELLTQQIQAVWPDCRVGFLGDAMDVVLYFAADPSDADIAQAQQICAAHDPTQLSADQIATAAAAAAAQQQQITIAGELAQIETALQTVANATIADLAGTIAALKTVAASLASTVHVIGTLYQ